MQGEHVEGGMLITVLFTDTEASTALQFARGDAAALEVVGTCKTLACQEIERFGGRVVKSLGDGLMVAFESPRRAVATAVAISRAVTEHSLRNPQLAARVRGGLHTGEVLEVDGDLHGATVSAASRICGLADGGQILVSDVVRQLCGTLPGVSFQDIGRYTLKGFPERWSLYVVLSSESASGRVASTPFVGRSDYRAELRALL